MASTPAPSSAKNSSAKEKRSRKNRRDLRALNLKRKQLGLSKKVHKVVEFQFKRREQKTNVLEIPTKKFEFKSRIESVPHEDPSIWESRGL